MPDRAMLTIHRINVILNDQKAKDHMIKIPGQVCAVLEDCRELIAELATRPAFEAQEKVDG